MSPNLSIRRGIAMLLIALVVFLICAVRGWWPTEGEEAALAGSRSAAPVAGATSEAARATPDVRSRFVSSSPDRTRAAEDSAPPARFAFDALTEGREPLKTEARMFQAQKWEPDIAKNLDLPPGTPLQRRSAWYRVPELKFPLVRVDRIYRMDRGKGGAPGPVAPETKTASGLLAPPSTRPQASGPVAPPSAPEGELLWDNAMIADHLMVQAQLGISREQLQRALPGPCRIQSAVNAEKGLYLVSVPHEGDGALERAMLALNHESLKRAIQFAEPDFLMSGADTTANDTLFTTNLTDTTKQWHLPRVQAPLGWDVVKQPAAVGALSAAAIANLSVVAVVDTGVDYTHPDLAGNIWSNPGESGSGKETNGLDDDGNGKVDDWRGWNFVENNNNPMDDVGHGTHVAGIVGAVGNNATGAAGVCWGVKLLPLRIIKKVSTGTYGTYSDAVAAMEYIRTLNSSASRRVAVANHSWGGRGYSLAMLNAINNPSATSDPLPAGITGTYGSDSDMFLAQGAPEEVVKIKTGMTISGLGIPAGTLVVMVSNGCMHLSDRTTQAAAGTALGFSNPVRPKANGALHVAAAGNTRYNNDRFPTYPASIPSGFVVSVGASDVNDQVAVWAGGAGSNFGLLTVDLFAPGSSIWSTKWKAPGDPGYGYESRNGTSMAAPQVSGAVALLRMWQPALTEMRAKQIVVEQVDRLAALESKCLSRGRLNVAKVVDRLFQPNLQGSGGSTGGSGLSAEALSVGQGLTGQVAKGGDHTLGVRAGKVYAWGANHYGQLGPQGPSGTFSDVWPPVATATPVEVTGLDDVIMVAAGLDTSYALKHNGTVWSWGDNNWGQLGRGLTTPPGSSNPVPAQVMGLWPGSVAQPNAIWISAASNTGNSHVLVANADGTVWAWGSNVVGQLGDGTTTDRRSPVQVLGLSNVIMVSAGMWTSLALKRDGTVWQWPGTSTYLPQQVPGLTGIVHIAGDSSTSYAINEAGDVWFWGNRPGASTSYPGYTPTPLRFQELERMVYISAGGFQSLGVDADGRLWAWGNNSVGQLALPSEVGWSDPVEVNIDSVEGIGAVATSGVSCVALLGSGELVTWGQNDYGELGLGGLDSSNLPVQIPRLANTSHISSGGFPFAREQDGSWLQWGIYRSSDLPEAFEELPSVVQIESSFVYCYNFGLMVGRKADGTLWSWGTSDTDGNEIFGNPSVPADPYYQISASDAVQVQGVANVIDHCVSPGQWLGYPGDFFGLAVESSGVVKAWGRNGAGQLGDGTTTTRATAQAVTGLTGVTAVAAGLGHGLALKSNGTVWAWGANGEGQLGDGTETSRLTPVQVSGLTSVVQIGAGLASSIALKSDGTVWVWGSKWDSLTANVTDWTQNQKVPARVLGLPPIVQIAVSISAEPFPPANDGQTVLCLAADGRVWAWSTQKTVLGRFAASTVSPTTPAPVEGLSQVASIASGPHCGYAVRSDGTAWTWGRDYYGGMGVGLLVKRTPTRVLGFGGASQTLSTLGTGSEGDSWFLDNFSASELLSSSLVADEGDPDGDGIANLLEYALGLDPRQQSLAGLPAARVDLVAPQAQSEDAALSQIALFSTPTADLTSGKRYLALTVNRNGGIRQDVDYIIEVSEDLATWRSGDPHTIKVLDTAEVLEAYSATALEDAPRQFMRLRVQRREGFFCP